MRLSIALILLLSSTTSSYAILGSQVYQLSASDAVANMDFGDAVAISGDFVVVGAEDTAIGGTASAGAVYLFDLATGAEARKLTISPPASRQFGNAVGISGNLVIAGAEDENANQGAAYLFQTDGTQRFRLQASDPSANAAFGSSVAISGNRALIGAPGAGGFRGQAYLFDTDTGLQIGTPIQPAGLLVGGEFADTLGLDGNRAVIGLSGSGLGGPVHIYDLNNISNPLRIEPPVDPLTLQPVPGFGRSVGISGNRVIVGATPGSDEVLPGQFGRAFVFDATTGQQLLELRPNDSQGEDLFGEAVSIWGNLAIVSAEREPFLGEVNKTYLFDMTTGRQLTTMVGDQVQAGDEAAESIAIYQGRAVVGVESFDLPGVTNGGVAVVFNVLVGDYNKDGQLTCMDIDLLTAAIAAGSGPGTLDITGDGLVNADDLQSWLVNAGAIRLASGNPFRRGDANLDGVVDGSDFGIWNSNKFTNNAAWCSGDFNADGVVDGSDFGIWNGNKFTSSDGVSAVPEPVGLCLLGALGLGVAAIRLSQPASRRS